MSSATCANCSGAAGEMRAMGTSSSQPPASIHPVERCLATQEDALDVGPGLAKEGGRGLPRHSRDVRCEEHAVSGFALEREEGIVGVGRLDAIHVHRRAAEAPGIEMGGEGGLVNHP